MPKQEPHEKEYYLETHPYVSFGDNGTTASLDRFGDLIQISQTHSSSRSGLFSVDLPYIDEPYYVRIRAEQLMSAREIDGAGICAYTFSPHPSFHESPQQVKYEFIHDRWPLFTLEYDGGIAKVSMSHTKGLSSSNISGRRSQTLSTIPADQTSPSQRNC